MCDIFIIFLLHQFSLAFYAQVISMLWVNACYLYPRRMVSHTSFPSCSYYHYLEVLFSNEKHQCSENESRLNKRFSIFSGEYVCGQHIEIGITYSGQNIEWIYDVNWKAESKLRFSDLIWVQVEEDTFHIHVNRCYFPFFFVVDLCHLSNDFRIFFIALFHWYLLAFKQLYWRKHTHTHTQIIDFFVCLVDSFVDLLQVWKSEADNVGKLNI